MPTPSSSTRIRLLPPPAVVIATRVAPASMAFSTSSFTTLAGRSTTSPAAMRLIRSSGSWRMGTGDSPEPQSISAVSSRCTAKPATHPDNAPLNTPWTWPSTLAEEAAAAGEAPVGAVIVEGDTRPRRRAQPHARD